MPFLKSILRRLLPASALSAYHFVLSWLAAVWYRHPSRRMLVVGVTGTTGKSSTLYLLCHILEAAGWKVGCVSTLEFCDGEACMLNDKKMTMLGRFQTQRWLRAMADNGCRVALVETTSQGIVQHRHRHIAYDVAVLTNLSPEHIEAHGGFDNYKKAKEQLFEHLQRSKKQELRIKVGKTMIVNADSEYAKDFLNHPADVRWTFGEQADGKQHVQWQFLHQNRQGSVLTLNGRELTTKLWGAHNAANIACAAAVALSLGLPFEYIAAGIAEVRALPGRIELIEAGQPFTVIVDYAFEPRAMQALYDVVHFLEPKRIIHVFGATGGGRDIAKRVVLATYISERSAICIITNEDPYDDDPQAIVDDVAYAVATTGKKEGENLFRILDRRAAIQKAITLAQPGDIVLITGKGSEQRMAVAHGKLIPWDDRGVARAALQKK